jgi:putative peptidoglycan lipid II flippase
MGQWLVTAFEEWRLLPLKEWLKPQLFSAEFKKLIKPLSLGAIGIGAVQCNSALDAIFARMADLQGPAFLWYAIRIEQLPFSLLGLALSGALLPALVREPERQRELLQHALKNAATLMIPCTFGMFALGTVGINLLYGHGSFSPSDVVATTHCLWAYGAGLAPSVFVLLLAARFYAEKNYRQPTLASLGAVALNVALNALFVFGFGWGTISVAIATTLSACVNMALLARGTLTRAFWMHCGKVGGVSALIALLVISVERWTLAPLPRDLGAQLIQFMLLGGLFIVPLGGLALRYRAVPLR